MRLVPLRPRPRLLHFSSFPLFFLSKRLPRLATPVSLIHLSLFIHIHILTLFVFFVFFVFFILLSHILHLHSRRESSKEIHTRRAV